jgi:hypothetical protein
LALFLLASPLVAANISGTWEISYWYGVSVQTFTLELTQDGAQVSGTGTACLSDGRDTVLVEVSGETVARRDFRLRIVDSTGSVFGVHEFIGGWFRDRMSGTTEGDLGSRVFRGTRQPEGTSGRCTEAAPQAS